MIWVEQKEKCCGCEACASICPSRCIEMRADERGFKYPFVKEDECIKCGRCERVCPVLRPLKGQAEPILYAVQNKDGTIRQESTSGGAFSVISKWILDRGGVVVGAAYDENFCVLHKTEDSIEKVASFRGSKYVQSQIGETFIQVKNCLEDGRWVCFSGTPCQVNGLKKYLEKEYEKLITVDVACRGVTSPAFLKKYLDYHRKAAGSEIVSLKFREKYYGYGFSTMMIGFENGMCYRAGMESDIFLRSFFLDLNIRESCLSCKFKTVERASDFTLFDGWHIRKYDSEMDDDKGTTLCIVQSEKGRKIFEEIGDSMSVAEVPLEIGIGLDGSMITKCVSPNSRRDEFFKDMNNLTVPEMQNKYYPINWKRKILSAIKPAVYKSGVFKLYMGLKEKGMKK